MTAITAPEAFSMGRVINRLFSVLGHNIVQFLTLSALLVGAPTLVVSVGQMLLFSSISPADVFAPGRLALAGVGFLVSIAANAVLQAAVIHASVNDLTGRKAAIGESLAVGLRYFLPLLGISIIVGIGCAVGFVLLIVPGVLLALALSVAAPAAVMERTGVFGALDRSIALTRNHRGAIFLLAIAYIIVMWIIEMAIGAVVGAFAFTGFEGAAGAAPDHLPQGLQAVRWGSAVAGVVINTLLASLSSIGIASIYFELRQAKEGVGADQLAAVFD